MTYTCLSTPVHSEALINGGLELLWMVLIPGVSYGGPCGHQKTLMTGCSLTTHGFMRLYGLYQFTEARAEKIPQLNSPTHQVNQVSTFEAFAGK